jgi:hypothetical protein
VPRRRSHVNGSASPQASGNQPDRERAKQVQAESARREGERERRVDRGRVVVNVSWRCTMHSMHARAAVRRVRHGKGPTSGTRGRAPGRRNA